MHAKSFRSLIIQSVKQSIPANYHFFLLARIILPAAVFLSGCFASPTPLPPLPTHTPLPPTETATATTVWFPPTSTFTPRPLQAIASPTPDLRPTFGRLLIEEDFSNPERWTLGRAGGLSAALGKSELTLAISEPRGYLYSLFREAVPGDFYAEITAAPSLCKDNDEYGLLLRVSRNLEFYRFSISCNGEARLDKYYNQTASSPQPLTPSGAIPPGAPSVTRLAVLARGKEISYYANGEFLFTVRDPSLLTGSLGVFARSASDNAVTVSFSDLQIYSAAP